MTRNAKLFIGCAYTLALLVLSGCDPHVYEIQKAAEGDVYVLNKYTGSLQRARDGKLVKVMSSLSASEMSANSAPKNAQSGSCESDYPSLGISFAVIYRSIGGKLYYRLSLLPSAPIGRSVAMAKWDVHLNRLVAREPSITAGMNLEFQSIDGFQLELRRIPLRSAVRLINNDGLSSKREVQGNLELAPEIFAAVATCQVGFYNLPEVGEEILEPPTKVEQPAN